MVCIGNWLIIIRVVCSVGDSKQKPFTIGCDASACTWDVNIKSWCCRCRWEIARVTKPVIVIIVIRTRIWFVSYSVGVLMPRTKAFSLSFEMICFNVGNISQQLRPPLHVQMSINVCFCVNQICKTFSQIVGISIRLCQMISKSLVTVCGEWQLVQSFGEMLETERSWVRVSAWTGHLVLTYLSDLYAIFNTNLIFHWRKLVSWIPLSCIF